MTAVFLNYDQRALDDAYDQKIWAPNMEEVLSSYATESARWRHLSGPPMRFAYGTSPMESLDVYCSAVHRAPVLILVHGGAWRRGTAADYAFPAEMIVAAGIHYVALDFAAAPDVGGDLRVLANQVQRAIAWVHANAGSFDGDSDRLYLAGHSSGAHLAAVALTADWTQLGVPADILKGGILVSGIYDLNPVRLSARSSYIAFDDDMVKLLSPCLHIDQLFAPLTIACGTRESPEFIRQAEAFAAAVTATGRPVEKLVVEGCNHFEIIKTLGRADRPLGRALLALIGSSADQKTTSF